MARQTIFVVRDHWNDEHGCDHLELWATESEARKRADRIAANNAADDACDVAVCRRAVDVEPILVCEGQHHE